MIIGQLSRTAPGRGFLESVFRGRKVLLLMDELAQDDATRADFHSRLVEHYPFHPTSDIRRGAV